MEASAPGGLIALQRSLRGPDTGAGGIVIHDPLEGTITVDTTPPETTIDSGPELATVNDELQVRILGARGEDGRDHDEGAEPHALWIGAAQSEPLRKLAAAWLTSAAFGPLTLRRLPTCTIQSTHRQP